MKKETVEAANKIIAEIKTCNEHKDKLDNYLTRSKAALENNNDSYGNIFISDPGRNSCALLFHEPHEVAELELSKCERHIKKLEKKLADLKD